MEIWFTKKENNKHVLTCNRRDGTCTWVNADEFFLRHDLMHYAVETILQFKTAFYGMIENGVTLTDFDLPKNKRNVHFSEEALLAEHIVNLLMVERGEKDIDEFNNRLNEGLQLNKRSFNNFFITDKQLDLINTAYKTLLHTWNELPAGETIILKFDE